MEREGRLDRLVTIISQLSVGGAELALLRLLTGLRDEFACRVIALGGDGAVADQLRDAGVAVTSLGMSGNPASWVSAGARIGYELWRCPADLLQGWMYHGNALALWAGRTLARRTPVVWNVRQTLAWDLEKWRTRRLLRHLARCSGAPALAIYNSRDGRERHREFGFRARRDAVIESGVDVMRFVPQPGARAWARDTLHLPDGVWVAMVARYHPMKDHPTALRAIAALPPRHRRVRFVLAGAGLDARNRAVVERIAELGLSDRVCLVGERHDLDRLLPAFDVAMLSSRTEGFPNALAEAMACGVPCVATAVGDTERLLGDTGAVAPPGSPQELAAALTAILDLPKADRQTLGLRARRRIEGAFAVDVMVDRFRQAYQSVLTGENAKTVPAGGVRTGTGVE